MEAARIIGPDAFARRGDGQFAAVGHGVARVDAQVEDRHLELVAVGLGRGQIVANHDPQLDFGPERAADQPGHAVDQFGQVDRGRLERLAASEGEQPLDEYLGAFGRLERTVDQPPLALAAQPAPQQHVERTDDRGQQIVEVMRHSAGELAHRFEFLRLAQRLLGLHQLGFARVIVGQVAANGDEVHPVGLGRYRPPNRGPSAGRGRDAILEAGRLPGAAHLLERGNRHADVVGVHELRIRRRQQMGLGPAQDCRPRRVHRRYVTQEIGPRQHVLGQHPQSVALRRFGLAPGAFGEHLVGTLCARAEQPANRAAFVAYRRVGKCEMRLARPAGAIEHQLDVRHMHRLARRNLFDQGREVVAYFGPNVEKRPPEPGGMAVGHDRRVTIVVKQEVVASPPDEHRLVRRQHDSDQRLERLRPIVRGAERRHRPVSSADQRARLAAPGEEGHFTL